MCRTRTFFCKAVIIFSGYVFGITLGTSDLFCTSFTSEAVAFPMCNNKTLNTTVTFVKNGTSAIYFNRNYSTMGTSSDCSCDVMVNPAPDIISVNYRRSPILGCAIFSFMQNSSSECRTKKVQLNETLSFIMFTTQSNSVTEHACFGIEIEDPYVADRMILVTCKPSTNDVPKENEEAVVSISSQLTARKLKENISDSAMIFTFQTVINSREETTTSSISTPGEVTNASKEMIIVASCGIIILIIFVTTTGFLVRRKHKRGKKTVRDKVSISHVNHDDLVVTDNVVYDDSRFDVTNGNDSSNDLTITDNGLYNPNQPQPVADDSEAEYSNSLRTDTFQTEYSTSRKNNVSYDGAIKEEVLTDEEKMNLYGNRYIRKTKTMSFESHDLCNNT